MTVQKEPYRKLIIGLSIVIPLAVAILFRVKIDGFDFSFLPPIYAGINGLTAILFVTAFVAIKNKKRSFTRRL
jgi:putative membrane protein